MSSRAAAQFVPSVLVLGQWWPGRLPDPGGIPGVGRWAGPRSGGAGGAGVALTFDDGPDPRTTPGILDLLDELGLVGTYFCLGSQAEANPGLVKDLARRGHEVGVHGHSHERHLFRSPTWIRVDLERAVSVLEDLTGASIRWFRPPFGQVSGGSVQAARQLGLDLVLWSAWGREWSDRDPASVARRVAGRLRPGAVVLLHDSDADAPPGTAEVTARALPAVAAAVSERGLRAVTLSELFASP